MEGPAKRVVLMNLHDALGFNALLDPQGGMEAALG
jgi:hypothetical protein